MLKRMSLLKFYLLCLCIVVIGFFAGYDYALITSGDSRPDTLKREVHYPVSTGGNDNGKINAESESTGKGSITSGIED